MNWNETRLSAQVLVDLKHPNVMNILLLDKITRNSNHKKTKYESDADVENHNSQYFMSLERPIGSYQLLTNTVHH